MEKEQIELRLAELGLTITSEFVPFSQSRNKGEKHRSLNWRVTLQKNGRDVLTANYGAGYGHCPRYKQTNGRQANAKRTPSEKHAAIVYETENGRAYIGGYDRFKKGAAIKPAATDVVYSLMRDADVLESSGFEDWAAEYGYESDSRAAEKTYRDCLEIALKLQAGIGTTVLMQLREIFQDY